jgi:hypothetical protein
VNFPKVELRKFDGTEVFTSVNQIEQYFELHDIMDDKQRIHIATLKFEIKPYQWYQWVVKRKPPFLSLYFGFIYKRLGSTIWGSLGTRLPQLIDKNQPLR